MNTSRNKSSLRQREDNEIITNIIMQFQLIQGNNYYI